MKPVERRPDDHLSMTPQADTDSSGVLPRPMPAPSPLDDELGVLLDALQAAPDAASSQPRTERRRQLFERIARSAEASAAMHTVRRADVPPSTPAPGVTVRTLYQAPSPQLRAGEPRRVQWIELAPGARWSGPWPADGLQRDWLVVNGRVRLDELELGALDYHLVPGHAAVQCLASEGGATLYLREAPPAEHELAAPITAFGRGAEWAEFAPGIKRRLLWTQGGLAAMLYHALPGAGVPRHGHGHDEECLMLEGELFLDDVLLRAGEYQLAPAGTRHGGLFTDTGVVIYAHGDLELALEP